MTWNNLNVNERFDSSNPARAAHGRPLFVGEISDVGLVEGRGGEEMGGDGEGRCKRGSTERDAREVIASIQVAGRVILGVVDGDKDDCVEEPYDGAFGSKLHPADETQAVESSLLPPCHISLTMRQGGALREVEGRMADDQVQSITQSR
jgi:hypothetical protein